MSYLINMDRLTEEEKGQRQILEAKRLKAIEYLGEKWVMHRKHSPVNNGVPVGLIARVSQNRASRA